MATGAGARGNPQSFALIQEIRRWFDGPLALSGSIATGRAVLAAQAMGADFAYIGSAFIATDEANANAAYKQPWSMVVRTTSCIPAISPGSLEITLPDLSERRAWIRIGCLQVGLRT